MTQPRPSNAYHLRVLVCYSNVKTLSNLIEDHRVIMRVTMIGAGYVGLVSSACITDFGHKVSLVGMQKMRRSGVARHSRFMSPACRSSSARMSK